MSDWDLHAQNARAWLTARRDYLRLTDRVEKQTSSVAQRFDKIMTYLNVGALHDGEIKVLEKSCVESTAKRPRYCPRDSPVSGMS